MSLEQLFGSLEYPIAAIALSASFWFLIILALIGGFLDQKKFLTERRRNSLVTLSLLVLFVGAFPDVIDFDDIVPGLSGGDVELAMGFVALTLALMTVTYLFFLVKETIFSLDATLSNQSTDQQGIFVLIRALLLGAIFWIKDFAIPVSTAFAAVASAGDKLPHVISGITATASQQLIRVFTDATGPQTKESANAIGIALQQLITEAWTVSSIPLSWLFGLIGN